MQNNFLLQAARNSAQFVERFGKMDGSSLLSVKTHRENELIFIGAARMMELINKPAFDWNPYIQKYYDLILAGRTDRQSRGIVGRVIEKDGLYSRRFGNTIIKKPAPSTLRHHLK